MREPGPTLSTGFSNPADRLIDQLHREISVVISLPLSPGVDTSQEYLHFRICLQFCYLAMKFMLIISDKMSEIITENM